jgi:hypothetical protein
MKTLIYAISAALVLATSADSQPRPVDPVSVPVHDLTLDSRPIDALVTLAQKYHVVIGIYGASPETSIENRTESLRIHVSLKDGRLSEVLDSIVRADPRLKWRKSESGAIHLVARNDLPLLDVVVHSFDTEALRRMDVSSTVPKIPEVASWLKDHGCIIVETFSSPPPPKEWGKLAVHVKDMPLSAVLDDIAARTGTYFWSMVESNIGRCTIDLQTGL